MPRLAACAQPLGSPSRELAVLAVEWLPSSSIKQHLGRQESVIATDVAVQVQFGLASTSLKRLGVASCLSLFSEFVLGTPFLVLRYPRQVTRQCSVGAQVAFSLSRKLSLFQRKFTELKSLQRFGGELAQKLR